LSFPFAGTLTVEEVYKDRDQFAALVREVAAPDVGRMGIEILSFTIKDVYDDVQYLASLGKAQTASVKRDADAGVAEANRDAGIREAECEKGAMDVKYSTDTKIEDNSRMFKLQKANFDQEINTAVSGYIGVKFLKYFFIYVFLESGSPASLRTTGGQDPPENP
jgi:flotillin